ncbi:MAG TPA: hypothetical protein PK036_08655 [Geobacteraceae bacterium]|nr:hypothetical protein [Geobacteraceae bacterium]
MAIEPIAGSEKISAVQDQARKTYQSTMPNQQQQDLKTEKNRESVSVSIQRASSTMGRLGSFNEEKNLIAKNIRSSSEALSKASDLVDGLKENLGKIIKNYPPFPQDSAERKEILMSYISLRKEILSMTFPPPPAPVYEKNTSLWDKLGYTGTGSMASSVPEISSTATDAEVLAASKTLGDLGSDMATARKELVGFVTD